MKKQWKQKLNEQWKQKLKELVALAAIGTVSIAVAAILDAAAGAGDQDEDDDWDYDWDEDDDWNYDHWSLADELRSDADDAYLRGDNDEFIELTSIADQLDNY